jgi:hypothetical protein
MRVALLAAQREALSLGTFEAAFRALDVFSQSVRDALIIERQHCRLKLYSAVDECKAWLTELQCAQFGGSWLTTLHERGFRDGERIASVDVNAIHLTNGRVITRADLRELAPIGVSLPSNNGLGGSFRCEQALVIAVDQFEPGPRSVYRRIDG